MGEVGSVRENSDEVSETSKKMLTIRVVGNSEEYADKLLSISPAISFSPHLNSPSPPSSAFVSALQSPYISPRAVGPLPPAIVTASAGGGVDPSYLSVSGTHSDDLPSSSHTSTSERFDLSADLPDPSRKFSFSFPAISPPSFNVKLRTCDVYIGFFSGGGNPNLPRFCKWIKSELELQGIASFVVDRAKYSDTQSHDIADRLICAATFGLLVVSRSTFVNPSSVEEIRFFAQKKNLIPLLFDISPEELSGHVEGKFEGKECMEAFELVMKFFNDFKLEAIETNWRSCVSTAVGILRSKLGRKNVAGEDDDDDHHREEIPFVQNKFFVGREKEIAEMESILFGNMDYSVGAAAAAEESDNVGYISLEMKKKHREPALEAWIDPTMAGMNSWRSSQKPKSKSRRSKGKGGSVLCINGVAGVGKTELAVEFAHRYSQRYKKVLWVGGEARFLRQNILNLAGVLGLDVGVCDGEGEKDRGRIRSFEEQELEAFQRVKRELFRDVPYLLVIDNLETNREWWEGKDLHDLIPRNTGASHVVLTTRLAKVMSFEPMYLGPLMAADSLVLIGGRRKNSYQEDEVEVLRSFEEKLEGSTFGMWMVGSLLSELSVAPSAMLEAVEKVVVSGQDWVPSSPADDAPFQANPFLMKLLFFSFAVLDRTLGRRLNLAARMVLAGAWLAPSPISSEMLVAAARYLPEEGTSGFAASLMAAVLACCAGCPSVAIGGGGIESAAMLVKLGLAKKCSRQPGFWIQFHPITQSFAKNRGGPPPSRAAVLGVRKTAAASTIPTHSDHLWASAFLVFGFKLDPPRVQLKVFDMVLFIKKAAIPLAVWSFKTFSRCTSSLELLKVCTNVLDEAEKSFAAQAEGTARGPLCWRKMKKKKKKKKTEMVDEFVWQEVTLLKASLLETRAKLLMKGGMFENGEELCRTCISIRTVLLGHNHVQTLNAQETLAKMVRMRSKA